MRAAKHVSRHGKLRNYRFNNIAKAPGSYSSVLSGLTEKQVAALFVMLRPNNVSASPHIQCDYLTYSAIAKAYIKTETGSQIPCPRDLTAYNARMIADLDQIMSHPGAENTWFDNSGKDLFPLLWCQSIRDAWTGQANGSRRFTGKEILETNITETPGRDSTIELYAIEIQDIVFENGSVHIVPVTAG